VGDMVVGAAAGDLKSEGVRGVVGARGAGDLGAGAAHGEGRRGGAGATPFEEGESRHVAQGYEEMGEQAAKSRSKREASPIAKTRGNAAVLDR
jgi:hypothetical protein